MEHYLSTAKVCSVMIKAGIWLRAPAREIGCDASNLRRHLGGLE
jgi:hypothetical protein